MTPSALLTSPTSVVVEGKTLTLGAALWRDFMPLVAPGDGSSMISVMRVQTEDGSAVPAAITADTVWLVRSTEVWSGIPREERARDAGASSFEIVARDGPKWDVGAAVDVVVQLRTGGGVVRLRRPNQVVQATY